MPPLLRVLGRRLIGLPISVLVIGTFAFGLIELMPGDPVLVIAGDHASDERIALIRTQLELDQPLPEELLHGHVNVDGTGAAWWNDDASAPLRYVTERSPWSDPNLPTLAPALVGSPVLAAVRGATPGIGFGVENVPPFVSEGLAAVHNGWIGGFHSGVGRTLVAGLSDQRFTELGTLSDSLVLFLMTVDRVIADPSLSLSEAVAGVIGTVAKVVVAVSETATLNLVVASADEIVAARTSVDEGVNSLYTLESDGLWIASEPLDPTQPWQPVPEHSLVRVNRTSLSVTPLSHEGTP